MSFQLACGAPERRAFSLGGGKRCCPACVVALSNENPRILVFSAVNAVVLVMLDTYDLLFEL